MSIRSGGIQTKEFPSPVVQNPLLTIRGQLRQATAALHTEIEQKLDLNGLPMDRYRVLLETFYGFHAPLEARIANAVPAAGFAWPTRSALLERWIEDVVREGAPEAEIVESACATLRTLLHWSQDRGVARA